jgi:hypothetical protein
VEGPAVVAVNPVAAVLLAAAVAAAVVPAAAGPVACVWATRGTVVTRCRHGGDADVAAAGCHNQHLALPARSGLAGLP